MRLKTNILLLLFALCSALTWAQDGITTGLQGRVRDAETNEPIPFVQIVFDGTTVGAETDMDGRFSISNNQGYTSVSFRMMGYESQKMKIQRGKTKKRVTIKMVPRGKTLGTVEITAKKGKNKYSRKHNPAVDLVRKVIDHKEKNRVEAQPHYRRDVYERLSMSLDDFNPDFEGKRLWRKLNFLEKYIDETEFDATPILVVSMRELLAQESYRKSPKQTRRLVTGKRMEGLDEVLSDEGIDENIRAMFNPVDIYDGDIELMLNHFTSPLSPVLAVSFYKFYITDTTFVDGQKCVELSFVPANQQSYGFTGRMYVSLDPDSTFALTNMYISKHIQELYVHQMRVYTGYDLSDTVQMLPDSLFSRFETEVTLPRKDLMRYKSEFAERRPVKLSAKETVLDSMWVELARLPEFKTIKYTGEVFTSGYIPTAHQRSKSKFDIVPVFIILSFNHEEGWRVRLGGMTKAELNPRNFLEGYAAYGFRDKRPKGSLTYTHTFDDKDRHSHEAPFSSFSINGIYELQTPGQSYDNFDRDNIMSSSDKEMNVQYVAQGMMRLRKEWKSHVRFDTWLAARHYEPSGSLVYLQYQDDGSLKKVDFFTEAEWHVGMSFTPNFSPGTRRRETQSNLRKDAPSISIGHTVDLVDGVTWVHTTDFSAEKRIWLSSFGHIDAKLTAGAIWNRAPYTRLYIPSGNSSIWVSNNSFNSMQPMEFIMDRYVAFFATYHLKGWILNRIPLINRLRLREVMGFNILYGGLTDKNNVDIDCVGLYKMPDVTKPFGDVPYMEYSLGIENILRIFRIDFVRRLTYVDGWDKKDCWFVRIDLKFAL